MLVVVSCGDRVPTWRRTELDLRSCKPFDNQHRPPTTFGAKPSIARTAVDTSTESKVTRWWHVCDWPGSRSYGCARNLGGSRCNRKRRKNSSTDRGSNFCSLLWAESRQRNVTVPSANETRRRLEMATATLLRSPHAKRLVTFATLIRAELITPNCERA